MSNARDIENDLIQFKILISVRANTPALKR